MRIIILNIIVLFFFSFDVFAQLVQDFRVNNDTGSAIQSGAKLGIDGQGNFVIIWRDDRVNICDVYCQIFNSNAQRVGNNFKINSSLGNWGPGYDIAVRKNGTFVVCWRDTLVRLRIFNSIGVPISSEIIVNNISFLGSEGLAPAISGDTLGNFIVVWRKPLPNGGININFQRFDSLGNKIGTDVKVNEDTADNGHNRPDITIRRDGSFIITWEQIHDSTFSEYQNIFMQIFNKNGVKIGNNVKVFNRLDPFDQQWTPKVSSDDSGRFCIGFSNQNFNSVDWDAIVQLYNSNGAPSGGPIYIDLSYYDEFFRTIFKRKNGDFIVGYQKEFSLAYYPYCQRFNANGQIIGTPFRLSDQTLSIGKDFNDVAIYNDKMISVWYDWRNGTDGDIFCNIRSFAKPDSVITSINIISNEIPENWCLFQNYPNPFNNSTQIKYKIAKSDYYGEEKGNSFVAIKIFNLLGQEILNLINENQIPGLYQLKLDCGNLPTGLYFYSLIVDGSKIDTKKFLLIK